MAIDWRKSHTTLFDFVMVSPTDIDHELGSLTGVELSSVTLTWGYYTDTRVSGAMTLIDSNYIEGAFVRIKMQIPEFEYETYLATLLPTADPVTYSNGSKIIKLSLQSILYGMSKDIWYWPYTIQYGSSYLAALHDCIKKSAYYPYKDKNPNDYVCWSSSTLTGSWLKRAFECAHSSDNRITVDGYGNIIVGKYIQPANRTAEYEIIVKDVNSLVEGDYSRKSDFLTRPSRVVVEHMYNENSQQYTVYGSADVPRSDPIHYSHRGYVITDFRTVSELEPNYTWRANEVAANYLKFDATELAEWTIKLASYMPLTEGTRVKLAIDQNGSKIQTFVKSCEFELASGVMELTLKEIQKYETEE